MKIYRSSFHKIFIAILLLFIILICSVYIDTSRFCAVLVFVFSIALIYEFRNNIYLTLIFFFIAYVNYSITVGVYLATYIRPNGLYGNITDPQIYIQGINTLLVFMITVYCFCQVNKERLSDKSRFEFFEPHDSNILIEIICIIVYVVIFITQFRFVDNGRATTSPLSEYRFIFMIFGGLYSDKKPIKRIIWVTIIAITSLLTFSGGNRVNAFPGLILLIILWFPRIKFSIIAWLFPIFLVFLQLIGEMRYNFSLSVDSFVDGFSKNINNLFTTNSFLFAFYPSLTAIDLSFVQPWAEKTRLLYYNLVYVFLGGRFGQFVLPNYTHNYYLHYYGFIGPLYFNYWCGVISGFVAGVIVVLFARLAMSNKTNLFKQAIVLCFAASCPRWYCYNFLQLPRAMLFMIIMYWFFHSIDSLRRPMKIHKKK